MVCQYFLFQLAIWISRSSSISLTYESRQIFNMNYLIITLVIHDHVPCFVHDYNPCIMDVPITFRNFTFDSYNLYNLVHLDYNTLPSIDRGLMLIRCIFVTLNIQFSFVFKDCAHCSSFYIETHRDYNSND